MSEPRYRFGQFVFDARRRVLERRGDAVALPNKALELLALLLRDAGNPVSKERIYEAIWGDKIVDDGNLTQTVYMLRRALANGSSERSMIRTIPQLGYAFVEEVSILPDAPPRRGFLRPAAIAASSLAAIALLFYGMYGRAGDTGSANAEALLPTPALKAYELGRQAWNKPTRASALQARRQFESVVRLAPSSALGYAGLSDAHLLLGGQAASDSERSREYRLARSYAQRALALDPNSSEAHASSAQALYYGRQNGAQHEYERAVVLNPKNALAHRWFGEYWIMQGRFENGANELARSNAIQPLVSQDLFWLGVAQYYAGHYSAATQAFRESIADGERDPEVAIYLALSYDASGDTAAALRELDRLQHTQNDPPDVHAVRASILAMHGQDKAALREIEPFLRAAKRARVSAISMAVTLARTGQIGAARNWLREHHTDPDESSVFPSYDPRLAGLHLRPLPPPNV
jgi:DNA-binding winged helix-turn-helix (wHTH) protein/Tfp pilus assembly protein PilF